MPDRLMIVGGGAAGMSAASAARRTAPGRDVVVVEASGYAAWGLCGLPYYVGGVVAKASDLIAYPPQVFREQRGIDLRLHTRAVALDADRRRVVVEHDGGRDRLGYGALIVTAGAAPVVPPLGLPDDDRIFSVRALEDAMLLRSRLDAGRIATALVVGAGYVGLEMAEALAARGCDVVVVDVLDRVMANLDPEVAAAVAAEVGRHAELRLGVGVVGVAAHADELEAQLSDGSTVTADVVVLAVGVRPNGGIAAAAGAEVIAEGALRVDDRMRTTLPDVYAAGDCAAAHHRVLGGPAYVPLGPAANKMGRVAGVVAAGGDARFGGIVGTVVVKVFDLTVARTGLTLTEARAAGLEAQASDTTAPSRAKYYPGSAPVEVRLVHTAAGRLLGAQLVSADPGAAKRIDVLATALHAGFDLATLAELDLSYAPPYAPVWDPVLRAAQDALRRTAPRQAVVA